MSKAFYEEIADALVGFLPPALRSFQARAHSRGLKVWFGEQTNEHYEVQVVPRSALTAGGIRGGKGAMIEVGFHAEHPDAAASEAVLQRLMAREKSWRRVLGSEPVGGAFIGRQRAWRRLSELWDDDGLGSEEAAIEAAERLARYIAALEPLRIDASPATQRRARG